MRKLNPNPISPKESDQGPRSLQPGTCEGPVGIGIAGERKVVPGERPVFLGFVLDL